MSRTVWIPILGLAVGCAENHFASDEAWLGLPLEPNEKVQIEVGLEVQPEAWPRALFSDAVRLAYYTDASQTEYEPDVRMSAPEARETIRPEPGSLNLLDAFGGCDPDQPCVVTVPITVRCTREERCRGGIGADAYLSTRHGGSAPDGALILSLSAP